MPVLPSRTDRLRAILASGRLQVVPCAHDGLSARMIEKAGFPVTFLSGFAASAARLGAPDLGLMSFGEMLDQTRNLAEATALPFLADGDTGHGNAMNVMRTVQALAAAGASAVMIEDQVSPKRCGHTTGPGGAKPVVERDTALARIRAAVAGAEAARAAGHDVMILARTDARHAHGLDEAIARARAFHDLGAEITFVEAPRSAAELARIGAEVPGWRMVNLIEGGRTPVLPPADLQAMGFHMATWPLALLSVMMQAMDGALTALAGQGPMPPAMDFAEVQRRLGFAEHDAALARFEG